jgi:hypothetical protein
MNEVNLIIPKKYAGTFYQAILTIPNHEIDVLKIKDYDQDDLCILVQFCRGWELFWLGVKYAALC